MRLEILIVFVAPAASSMVPAWCQLPTQSASSWQAGSISDEEFALPVDDDLGSEIDAWITKLGSPVYQERETATDHLTEIGARTFSRLRAAYHETDELEVRLRIEEITRAAYLNYHVYDRHGFLGVSLSPYSPDRHQEVEVPEGIAAVVIMAVIKETGAERARLLRNDVIIAVDGKPLEGSWNQVVGTFAEWIRSRRPGTVLLLTLIRGSKVLDVEATVGRCPEEQVRNGRVRGIPELLRQAEERFPVWWVEHFRQLAVQSRDDDGS